MLNLIGNVVAFAGILIAVFLRWPLPVLASIFMAPPFIVAIVGYAFFVTVRLPEVRLTWPRFERSLVSDLFSTGALVVICYLGYTIIAHLPVVIIANQFGAAAVAPVAVTQKLVGAASLVIAPMLTSLWSPIGEAAARGEFQWVHKCFFRALRMIIICYPPLVAFFTVLGRPLVHLWTGDPTLIPSWLLLFAIQTGTVIRAFNQLVVTVLAELNRFVIRAITTVIAGLIAFFLSTRFAEAAGVSGIVWIFNAIGASILLLATVC